MTQICSTQLNDYYLKCLYQKQGPQPLQILVMVQLLYLLPVNTRCTSTPFLYQYTVRDWIGTPLLHRYKVRYWTGIGTVPEIPVFSRNRTIQKIVSNKDVSGTNSGSVRFPFFVYQYSFCTSIAVFQYRTEYRSEISDILVSDILGITGFEQEKQKEIRIAATNGYSSL